MGNNWRTRWRPADIFSGEKWVEWNFYHLEQTLTWTTTLNEKKAKDKIGLKVVKILFGTFLRWRERHWGCICNEVCLIQPPPWAQTRMMTTKQFERGKILNLLLWSQRSLMRKKKSYCRQSRAFFYHKIICYNHSNMIVIMNLGHLKVAEYYRWKITIQMDILRN